MVWTSLLRKINIKRKRNVGDQTIVWQNQLWIHLNLWQPTFWFTDWFKVGLPLHLYCRYGELEQRNFISENKKSFTVIITQTKYENFWQCCLVYIIGTLQKSCIGDWKIPSYSWYGPNFVTIGKYQMSKILWILLLCWSLGSVGVVENANCTYKWMNKNGGRGGGSARTN